MGTKSTQELQKIIKDLCSRAGLSQKELARRIYREENEIDNEDEIRHFEERFKKDLTRPTTQPNRLLQYLDTMRQIPAIEKADLVIPKYYSTNKLDKELEKAISQISKGISSNFK